MKKRIISLLLVLVLVFALVPVNVLAASTSDATVNVESVTAVAGATVDVNVKISNNPGIAGATFTLAYHKDLTLIKATSGAAFSGLDFTQPGTFTNPCNFTWDSENDEATEDGVVLTLTFQIAETAKKNSKLNVEVSYRYGDIFNNDKDLNLDIINGNIIVIDYIPGDVYEDGVINSKDTRLIRQYIAGGYNITINEAAADVNDDGVINSKDTRLIRRYIAGGYDVELLPSTPKCKHGNMKSTPEKAATCTEDGNTAYWYCEECEKYFADKDGKTETTLEKTVIKAGHTLTHIEAKAATAEEEGCKEHWVCSACGKYYLNSSATTEVSKEDVVIAKLVKKESQVIYNIYGSDTYLESVGIENADNNKNTFYCEDGLILNDLIAPAGYIFKGWTTAAGTPITEIEPSSSPRQIVVNAVWEKVVYKINFSSELIPVESETYTVDEEHVLPSPKLDGYIFTGWSDDNGNVFKKIPVGTIGAKTYLANWVSERNLAYTKKDIGDPVIVEDDETKTILFAYEIGEIRNVPLYVVEDFGKINSDGITKTVTKEISRTVQEEQMSKYTTTVARATTDSFGFTLSNAWSDSITVNEEWCQKNSMTEEEAETICKSDTSGWYVSDGSVRTDTTVTYESSNDYDLQTTTNNTKTYDSTNTEKRQDFSAELDVDFKTKLGVASDLDVGVDLKYSQGKTTNEHTGTDTDEGDGTQTGGIEHNGEDKTHTSTTNHESGKSASSTVTNTESLMKSFTEELSQKTGYGKSYIQSEDNTKTQGFSSTDSSGEEISNSVTYSTTVSEKETVTYTTSNAKSGYHRWIYAGTAHVFGVIGYDIATSSYFVTTVSIMDDESHPYEDYSYSYASYDDNQYGVITFEAPNDILEYVAQKMCRSEGLKINDKGIVTGYTGTDEFVVIPDYDVVDNKDGTYTVNKVVGFTSTAFKGNTKIYGLKLSEFITEIPDDAFNGCTKLDMVQANGITSVGSRAFANCSSLKSCGIGDDVEYLGDNAFQNLDYMVANASNEQVLKAAVNSGAKRITVYAAVDADPFKNTEITIPSTCERFKFNGMGKTFENVIINSNAQETIINRATFISTTKIPLIIDSPKVGLYLLTVKSNGIGLALKNDNSNVELYGTVTINSSGSNTMLAKSFTLNELDSKSGTLNVNNNILYCGLITHNNLLNCGGSFVPITTTEFDAQIKGAYNISFDTTGANTTLSSKVVYYGTEIGELPTPTRDYYTFDGWYTQASGGEQFTSATVFTKSGDITLYAHWTEKPVSGWVKASNAPSDAKIVSTKWSYTLKSYTESSSSSLSGWTKYDTKRTSWGSTQGPVYSDPSNGSRNVWSEQYVASQTTHYVYYHRYKSSQWSDDAHASSWARHSGPDVTYQLPNGYYSSTTGQRYSGDACATCGATNQWHLDYTYTVDNYATRWYYQEPVYTYYYYKETEKESSTYPSGDDISNIQEWVQYVAK